MLNAALKQAIEAQDWETAKQIDALLHSEIDRKIKQQQLAKLAAETDVAEMQVDKIQAETEKLMREKQTSLAGAIGTITTAIIAVFAFIKSLFK